MSDDTLIGKSAQYRASSEALHRDASAMNRCGANLRMLWACGLADLIRRDFYGLFEFGREVRGDLLDAGCGTGIDSRKLVRAQPGLRVHGVDISSVALAGTVGAERDDGPRFYQSSLEALPFRDGVFDYIASHEVIEHVEDPAIVLREFQRVLKPGGVCVIATPNGASIWVEHVRQRLARLIGRRGAPVGEDHVRPPSFWRRSFRRSGLVVERQIFDGAALEFLTYVAPARWMTPGARLLEPLRAVPFVNLLLCDRVKLRLRKPGITRAAVAPEVLPVCAICRAELRHEPTAAMCRNGHRFPINGSGLIDFTSLARDGGGAAAAPEAYKPARRSLGRRVRRIVLAGTCVFYVAFLALLLPFGFLIGRFRQPLDPAVAQPGDMQ